MRLAIMISVKQARNILGKEVPKLGDQSAPSAFVLKDLVNLLLSVETDSNQARLNETSIDDNNGGRIML